MHHRLAPLTTLLLAAAIAASACSDADEPADDLTATDTAMSNTGPTTQPDADSDTELTDTTRTETSDTTCSDGAIVTIITGLVHDDAGVPIAGARPQACVRQPGGKLVCLRPGESDDDGRFAQSVPFEVQCMAGLTLRVLRPLSPWATTYCPLELAPDASPVLALPEPIVLHTAHAATTLPEPGDGSTVHTVAFAEAGLELDVAPAALYFAGSAGWSELAAARVPLDAPGLCFLDPDEPAPSGLIAFYPEADVEEDAASLRIANTDALPAGTPVEVDVLGGLDCRLADGTLVPEGTWASAGTATVSADGSVLELPALPCLTWLRWRAASPP